MKETESLSNFLLLYLKIITQRFKD